MPSEEPGARRGEAFHLLAWSADVRRNLVRRGEAGPRGMGRRSGDDPADHECAQPGPAGLGVRGTPGDEGRFGLGRVRSPAVVSVELFACESSPRGPRVRSGDPACRSLRAPPPGESRTESTSLNEMSSRAPRPPGSRFCDVTSGRIVRGGLARIERRRIMSR